MGLVDLIADLTRNQHRGQTEAIRHNAAIQAEMMRQNAQIWGGTIGTLGQIAASIPGQIQQAKAQQQQQQIGALQLQGAQLDLASKQRQAKSEAAFTSALQDPKNWNEDGSVNSEAVSTALRSQDIGAWRHWNDITAAQQERSLKIRKEIGEIAKNDAELGDRQRKYQAAQRDYLGSLAFNAERMLSQNPDDPLHARDTVLASVARAAADGAITEQQAKDFLMQTAQANPQQYRQIFGAFVPPEMRGKLEKEAADTDKSKAEAAAAQARANVYNTQGTLRPRQPGAVGSFEDYVTRTYGQNPTPDQILAARKAYGQADDKATGFAAGDVTKLTPAGLDMAALAYRKTGIMPPLGMGDKWNRQAIINRAATLTPEDIARIEAGGTDIAGNKATFGADADSLKALQKQRDAIGAFENTARKNIDVFLETAGKVVDTGSPLANSAARILSGKVLGSPDQAAYDAARQVAVNEIAKITSNPTLSGQLSDSARHEIGAFNPANATLKQTVAVMRLLKRDMDNRVKSLDDQIATIRQRIGGGKSKGSEDGASAPAGVPSYQDYLNSRKKGG